MTTERQSGLTLIELMIAVSVMAVILTTAVPALGNFMAQQRLTAAANQLVSHLNYARHEAVFRNQPVAACPSSNGLACTGGNRWDIGWIVYLDPEKKGQPDGPEDVLRVVEPRESLLMHSAGRYRVRFQGHGGAYGTNLTIRVCAPEDPDKARAVIVSNPGRIRSTRDVDPSECGGD
ncbi:MULTISPECIES: GspH/FimT family pseudopilin [unclassified Wenzhouxiangella]|uniref:GspH/FimT family pseudopilin n=1 Tax=unclassified Wenzhouxiangella TaxID=2613841 RepID=UPI000E3297D2|nr:MULTISPECIES: GspH/FimT family pseudopilin [unclassified Wenzhouxiangella]RFF26490.1 prepilin-type N-terminal cleavage/methylation domain-containing protein [Wenzhouxiangella sp. 15181]RFP67385.1 prepilin-type N-terminal cleavage/methylation domain-containing protein [Wenzhouxiangella sp. 15190]